MVPLFIEIKNLFKKYANKKTSITAVDNVNIDIQEKEFLVIAGRSGAGKSTLLKLIGGLEKPSSGKITINDNRNIGFIFQNFNLLPAYTVYENIELALVPTKMPKKIKKSRIDELLQTFELEEKANYLPSELSLGQQQKVAIARALANHPSLILADEPTGALDPITSAEIIKELTKLNQQYNVTLIVATHNASQYSSVSRVIYMKDGRIVNKGEAGYFTSSRKPPTFVGG